MDKRTVLAVALSLVVILAYQFFLLPKQPVRTPQPVPKALPEAPRVTAPAPVTPAPAAVPGVTSTEQSERFARQEATPARDIVIDSDLFRVIIDTRGGVAKSWQLKDYRDGQGQPVEIAPVVPPGTACAPGGGLHRPGADGVLRRRRLVDRGREPHPRPGYARSHGGHDPHRRDGPGGHQALLLPSRLLPGRDGRRGRGRRRHAPAHAHRPAMGPAARPGSGQPCRLPRPGAPARRQAFPGDGQE